MAADAGQCSAMGVAILRQGGSAVDAAVTVALCLGVVHGESSGIGCGLGSSLIIHPHPLFLTRGGGFILIRAANGSAEVVDGRETAPASADELMYTQLGNCTSTDPNWQQCVGIQDGQSEFDPTPSSSRWCQSRFGGLAVAVPGELRGLELAWQRHGKLPWATLVQPVAQVWRQEFVRNGVF